MFSYISQPSIYLQMRSQDHDATNTRTLDSSGNGRHASFGGPTKLTNKHGYYFDGNDYIQLTSGLSFKPEFSFAVEFEPFYAYNEGGDQFIIGSSPLSYTSIRILSSNLYLYFPGGGSVGISTATFAQFWKTKSRNIIVTSLKSGKNKMWLNGFDILTNVSTEFEEALEVNWARQTVPAWVPETLTTTYLGLYPSSYFTGNITRFAGWTSWLNEMQVADLQVAWQMKASEV